MCRSFSDARAIALTSRLLLVAALAVAAQAAVAAEYPAYNLEVSLEPATHRLRASAEVTLPAAQAGRPVEFVLAANFSIDSATPKVQKLPGPVTGSAFAGINGSSAEFAKRRGVARYRVVLPPGSATFRVRYQGLVDLPPATAAEEYARSFQETPGIIGTDGAYLAGTTLWYPYLGDQLVSYTLAAKAPPGWQLIAPGNGVATSAEGTARWESGGAVDEISLVGGPLTVYQVQAGAVQAQVYLRTPDPDLANRYLEATSRYLELYRGLIGPYPYGKFALVENFWETGYGMPSYTLLGPQVIRLPFIITSSYPHEILHNWWGNSVFVDYATGNWCEGLTAYMADHLMKEIEGQGAEYRRDDLKKFRDFVSTERDFPLREFRSRHSAATEAVGYGKTLMGFHALRLRVGDDGFRKSLARFYRNFRGHQASFADLRTTFEAVSGKDLARFFDEWTNRTGAADVVVENVTMAEAPGGHYTVTGVLRQRQSGPFELEVPIVVATAGGIVAKTVRAQDAATPFSVETTALPTVVAVDPEFDVFRVLDARETAPSIGQLFGAGDIVAVLPAAPAAETAAYRDALSAWQGPTQHITTVLDTDLERVPADKSVWLLGRGNRLAKELFRTDRALGLEITADTVQAGGQTLAFRNHSLVLVRRHPNNPAMAVGWIASDPLSAVPGVAHKLPHYGKYSWLGFEGAEPANVAKGEWPAADSPLLINLQRAGTPMQALALPRRQPLAELPAVFSRERLLDHVQFLAAPEREGRGLGSKGLEASGTYIGEQFAAAGLQPGGEAGGFFQAFTARGGPDAGTHTLRNVIGYIPGTKTGFQGQAAVVSAHYDHLGFGWPDVRADAQGKLHPGADDNASGVAVLIELARNLAAGPKPERAIVFVAFSGEEAGRLGSKHYVQNARPVGLPGIYGDVNMDTVGRLRDQPVSVLATESAREWPFVFQGITAVTGIRTRNIQGASESSDQQSFIDAGIPGVQIFSGANLDYHRPTDTADKIDGDGLVKVATVVREAVQYLASTDKRLTVTTPGKESAAQTPPSGEHRRVSLGTIPDFGFQGPGIRVDGVVPDSAAAAAGLQQGDVITDLGGQRVTDLGGYNELLKKFAPGDKVALGWTRNGKRFEANVQLTAR